MFYYSSIVPVITIGDEKIDIEQTQKNLGLKIAESINLDEVELQPEGQPVLQLSKIQKVKVAPLLKISIQVLIAMCWVSLLGTISQPCIY